MAGQVQESKRSAGAIASAIMYLWLDHVTQDVDDVSDVPKQGEGRVRVKLL